MRFRIEIQTADGRRWWEDYDKPLPPEPGYAVEWALDTIERFNDTLRAGEAPRRLMNVEVLEADTVKDHDWRKTNMVTIMEGSSMYDTYECSRCRITGKRFGLSDGIRRDARYKAAVYMRCDTSMKKRGKR